MQTMLDRGVLTPEQKRQWSEAGYLVLRQAIPKHELAAWKAASQRLHARFLSGELPNLSQDKETATLYPPHWAHIDPDADRMRAPFRRWRIIEDDHAFLDMLDHPGFFPHVLDLMGPYLQVSLTHLVVLPSHYEDKPYIHVDGGDALGAIRVRDDSPALSLKAMIFLSDHTETFQGNFSLLPGSHRRKFEPAAAEQIRTDQEAHQILVAAGDVILFPHAIWHGPAPNEAARARETLFVGYSHQFMRAYDYETIEPGTMQAATPRQRRLLGDLGGWEWRAGCRFYCGPDHEALMLSPDHAKSEPPPQSLAKSPRT